MSLSKREQSLGAVISFFALVLILIYIIFSFLGLDNENIVLSTIVVVFVVTGIFCYVVYRNYRKENKVVEIDYFNLGVQRYILGALMIFYGLPKLTGTFFDYQLFALDSKLGMVSEFELAWYYFGKNKWQELFAGIMEFVPGILLLNRKRYYLASLILLPVTAQVFILNFFFKIGGITFPAATILLACNVYIIYSKKENILAFFRSLDFKKSVHLSKPVSFVIKFGKWSLLLLTFLFVLLRLKSSLFVSEYQKKYENLVGFYSLQNMEKNGSSYHPANDSLYYKDIYIERQSRWNMLRRFNNKTNAFVLNISTKNDSFALFINTGGIGDNPDILDSLTALKGRYQLNTDELTLKGIQLKDTLVLNYRKQLLKPKQWFW